MYLPVLNLPNQDIFQRPIPYIRPRKLNRWLDSLPREDSAIASHQLAQQLQTINRSYYNASERLKLIELIQPSAWQIVSTLNEQLISAKLPYRGTNAQIQLKIQKLLDEMAIAYKLMVSELAILDSSRTNYDSMLSEAIYFAMYYQSLRLVQAYRAYQPEPEEVWGELHQLYRYALTLDIQDKAIDDHISPAEFKSPYTIERVYRRILLLAIAEPYNLMQNESDVVFRLTTKWLDYCNILPLGDYSPNNEYIIDLADDQGPRFITKDHNWVPSDGRIVDINPVRKKLNSDIQSLLRGTITENNEPNTLKNRNLRNLLMRLADSWKGRLSRENQRVTINEKIKLLNTINACHHFLSQQKKFTPAMDELKLMTVNDQQLESSQFTHSYQHALNSDKRHNRSIYLASAWYKINSSQSGLALSGDMTNHSKKIVKVGDLVAFTAPNIQNKDWKIGIVRWLKSSDCSNIDVGIMNIANKAAPVAIKGVSGVGNGTDYYRGLFVPASFSLSNTRKLIVPAFLYDINSALAINMGNHINYVRLTHLVLCTSSVAQFEFDAIDKSNALSDID